MASVERIEDRAPLGGRMVAFTHRRRLKRSEVFAHDLANYIVDSHLPPGTMLPREREMVEQLGVGRTTLREALRILETRGVLTVRSGPGGGPVVRHPQSSDLTEALTLILQFQRAKLTEVLDARIWLEPMAAGMAAAHITEGGLERLAAVNDEIRATVVSEDRIIDANQRFHRMIAGATGNPVVQVFCETLMAVSDSGVGEIHHSRAFKASTVAGHDLIIAGLEARNPAAAHAAMHAHVLEGRRHRVEVNPEVMARPLRWIQ
jgi:GntR family transcriptional regulator, transcriptional repressor for pyruvate dehydrogenase complex